MTRFFKFRLTTSFFLILILVACVNATPDANPTTTGTLEWSLYEEVVNIYANNELTRMTSSPPMAMEALEQLLPAPLDHPQTQPPRHSQSPYIGNAFNMGMSLDAGGLAPHPSPQFPSNISTGTSYVSAPAYPQDYAAMPGNMEPRQFGDGIQPWMLPQENGQSAPMITAAGSQFAPLPLPASNQGNFNLGFTSQPLPEIWTDAPDDRHDTPSLGQFGLPQFSQPMMQGAANPSSYFGNAQCDLPLRPQVPDGGSVGQPMPDYLNLQSSHNIPAGGMRGWLMRASTSGDCIMPRIDTTHLAPPQPNLEDRSPLSIVSSASSSRTSSRRNRFQMTLGMHPFICEQCLAGFDSQSELTHHRRCHQPYPHRRHVCGDCGKRFQYRKDLHRHAPKHDPNAPRFHCHHQGCKYNTNRGFGRQDHLERHLNSQHKPRAGPSRRRAARADTPQQ